MDGLWRGAARVPLWLVFLALAGFALMVRAQTLGDPVLGFDEQYYLLIGQRMLHGAVPYIDLWDRKPIGLFLIYALAAAAGPDPFVQYKLIAALFAAGAAFALYCGARGKSAGGALAAALLYLLWLNFMEGEGGQSPVFYNLPMLLAALRVRRAVRGEGGVLAPGIAAMALVGLALQIKYTVVFEGVFFGLALLWAAWTRGLRGRVLLGYGALWVAAALAPTLIAWGWYAAHGHSAAFVFANFSSIFGRLPDPLGARLAGLGAIAAILLPLGVIAALAWRRWPGLDFERLWLFAALMGLLGFGSFLSPSYGLPLLAPLLLCAAPWLGRVPRGRLVALLLGVAALVGGQLAVRAIIAGKGTRAQALALAAAARPLHGGCLWVYDGYPALYLLADSCVPTKWAFPGHLNTADENSSAAIGIAPVAEVRRILAARPEAIVDDFPAYSLGNRETRAIVARELARSYRLAARIQTGKARFRLVYRLK